VVWILFHWFLFIAVSLAIGLALYRAVEAVYRAVQSWRQGGSSQRLVIAAVVLAIGVVAMRVPRIQELFGEYLILVAVAWLAISLPRTAWRRRLHLAAVLVFVLVFVVNYFTADGLEGAILLLTEGDHTEYATSYSEGAFRRVRMGMSPTEVEAILGRPLDEWKENDRGVRWRWTRRGSGSKAYRMRVVTFRDGKVADVYVDVYPPF